MEISRKQDTIAGPAERFTGQVWFDEIGATEHTTVMSVHFTPGARTAWHSHPQGQVLYVTHGAGLVQSRGGDRAEIRAGDTVHAHPGEVHWHGAAPGTFLNHLAVQEGVTEWSEHVTDEEYQG
jgi:quercetin dioxygenase-like cupin family protein